MCGIIGVVAARGTRPVPSVADLLPAVQRIAASLAEAPDEPGRLIATLEQAAAALVEIDGVLRGEAGVRALCSDVGSTEKLDGFLGEVADYVDGLDVRLDTPVAPTRLEPANAALIRLKDVSWAIRKDRLASARAVSSLAGPEASPAAIAAYATIQTALAGLDRLEVRGRDSAGLHVLVTGHGLDLAASVLIDAVRKRSDRLFGNRAVRSVGGSLSLVYKTASEIGRLGDNGETLRAAIKHDALLRAAVEAETAQVTVMGHTRWASVGLINEANAHPLTSEEASDGPPNPYVVAALNGDVDNYRDLRMRRDLRTPFEITTDAKVIPILVARHLASGNDPVEAFRRTVAELDGSVAISAQAIDAPGKLMLAVRGSGQALYVGVAEDMYVVASEPYGLVEVCSEYLRIEGESFSGADGVRGQVVVLDAANAGSVAGIRRIAYDGTPLPVRPEELRTAQITTRDIDRRGYPHFLRKELDEAPHSLRKTLRGRIVEHDRLLSVALEPESIPAELTDRLQAGAIRQIVVIGQGTAAVAGAAVAAAIRKALAPKAMSVSSLPATELSGFGLGEDMRDTLAVAISQSGTTTDTNRTVDLLRARGSTVLAIVNRRGSDLTDKADGVLYTSDGRDIEMSVASTKAFYGQVAAGQLLALALAEAAGCADERRAHDLLVGLRELPDAMREVLAQDRAIAGLAVEHAPQRRSWAVVGNDLNRIAADEIRIKLSELCYKAVACDATEDKKHIDLSSEPLTIVCAAGLTGSAADDVAKEIAIFRAHDGIPLVIATDTETRFDGAVGVIRVPQAHPDLAFVLSTMAGHLFGYHAARAIDAQARPLREVRAGIDAAAEEAAGRPNELLARLAPALGLFASAFGPRMASGEYDGTLEASTACRLLGAVHAATGADNAWSSVSGPGAVVVELAEALTAGIDELTRPIDAIKHQAKTVTVGISRADEEVLTVPLVSQLLAIGVDKAVLPYAVLKTLANLDAAVAAVTGYTRYRIDGEVDAGTATISVIDKGGLAANLRSRTETDQRLRGNKQLVASERQVLAAIGRSDGRSFIIVPEITGMRTVGLTLLHVEFADRLAPRQTRRILDGYRARLGRLESAITETESVFDVDRLSDFSLVELLTTPIELLADRWLSDAFPQRAGNAKLQPQEH